MNYAEFKQKLASETNRQKNQILFDGCYLKSHNTEELPWGVSNVEFNKKYVKVGDTLNSTGGDTMVVTEVDSEGFEAYPIGAPEYIEYFSFKGLQLGWDFSGTTMIKNNLDFGFIYSVREY